MKQYTTGTEILVVVNTPYALSLLPDVLEPSEDSVHIVLEEPVDWFDVLVACDVFSSRGHARKNWENMRHSKIELVTNRPNGDKLGFMYFQEFPADGFLDYGLHWLPKVGKRKLNIYVYYHPPIFMNYEIDCDKIA